MQGFNFEQYNQITSELDPTLVRQAERFPVLTLINGLAFEFDKWLSSGLLNDNDAEIIRIASLNSDHGVNVTQMWDKWTKMDNTYYYATSIQKFSNSHNESVSMTLMWKYGNGPLLLTIETLNPMFGLSIYLSSDASGQNILNDPFIKNAQDFEKRLDESSNLKSFSYTLTDPMKKQKYTYHQGPLINSTFHPFICNFGLHVDLVQKFF